MGQNPSGASNLPSNVHALVEQGDINVFGLLFAYHGRSPLPGS
jgi:hypothetical protein